ncbi:MAG: phosphoribosylamine--glycine ligase [Bacteroidetes bacterium]|nr:phosphoribosylamine--glycine ligase [Bacteroidota bacterium]
MQILLLGSGGREHALAWKIAQSRIPCNLFIAPGNAGTSRCGQNVPISVNDFTGIRQFVIEHRIDMLLVGPEDPLVKGIHDFFLADPLLRSTPVIGPVAAAARLEGSKDFAKQFMVRHGIPTAAYQTFDAERLEEGLNFISSLNPPYVLKADGLAAGKGVVISHSREEALKEFTAMVRDARFGQASARVVVEEFLPGIECSSFVITDGNSYLVLPEAKDYKKIGEGDTGPNTGGMGSVSPVPFADKVFLKKVEDRIIRPTVEGLKQEGLNYIGFIFFGLMNVKGDPFVIEYNCRLGDPETESVIPRIKNDFVELLIAVAERKLSGQAILTDPRTCATVMLVSKGYPEAYEKGKPVTGETEVNGSLVFHAGTAMKDGEVLSNGGRVIAVTSLGNNMMEALETTYRNAEKIEFEGRYFRKDIGFDLK